MQRLLPSKHRDPHSKVYKGIPFVLWIAVEWPIPAPHLPVCPQPPNPTMNGTKGCFTQSSSLNVSLSNLERIFVV